MAIPTMQTDIQTLKQELSLLKEQRSNGPTSPAYVDASSDPAGMSRIDTLELKIDRLLERFDPARMIQSIASAAAEAATSAVFGAMREMEEVKGKEFKIVFSKLPEDGDDLAKVREMLDGVDGLNGAMVESVWRDPKSVPPNSGYTPILKAKVNSLDNKRKILAAAREKKFAPVFVRKDMTFRERQARRQMLSERFGNFTDGMRPGFDVNVAYAPRGRGGMVGGRGIGGSRGASAPGGRQGGGGVGGQTAPPLPNNS